MTDSTINMPEIDGDKGFTLGWMAENISILIAKYGEDALVEFDGGHNNVTAMITPSKSNLAVIRQRLETLFRNKGVRESKIEDRVTQSIERARNLATDIVPTHKVKHIQMQLLEAVLDGNL